MNNRLKKFLISKRQEGRAGGSLLKRETRGKIVQIESEAEHTNALSKH